MIMVNKLTEKKENIITFLEYIENMNMCLYSTC